MIPTSKPKAKKEACTPLNPVVPKMAATVKTYTKPLASASDPAKAFGGKKA